MFGIFADVFKRATYLEDRNAGYRKEEPPRRDIQQRAPFHWSFETRRRLFGDDNG